MAAAARVLLLVTLMGLSASDAPLPVRLVNGGSPCSGRVEVLREGRWGNICDDGWDLKDAEVVCRQLGCSRAIEAYSGAVYGPGREEDPIWLTDVKCKGTESSLGLCPYNEEGEPNCKHEEDAGVECRDALPVRLTNGSTPCNGRLEVQHQGEWGTVCDDSWGIADAKVVCRELGCGAVKIANACDRFGEGTGRIWLDQVQCTGKEMQLLDCPASAYGIQDCSHREDVGVVCRDPFKLRLLNGPHPCAGRLEVFHDGQWGTVCDDLWEVKNAEVVCRELECGPVNHLDKQRSTQATGPIWLDDVVCSGAEKTLENCKHRVWGYHDCTHREDVHVSCDERSP
ncbi:LOW QUALITY PROTEIN: soluble scavenger receptor cysteine-rich domain-containing protein SSC5D-like [Rhinatrema bivittatum]|uniref:LOW QUALITY PROTEIN: soluble scavenger receptor cysteine-rich domain-containing protein SSC5D-like n=1 Tax=Rhinatrema bivittatum TaxID=194408 RepID=UPI00112C21E4|nr:LOW QUALITY PROTEIN: soluble scavenger receptor cysteine-rich domain-containing protein SSC5D-like [Rhinatrema bivittatum]